MYLNPFTHMCTQLKQHNNTCSSSQDSKVLAARQTSTIVRRGTAARDTASTASTTRSVSVRSAAAEAPARNVSHELPETLLGH